MIIFGRLCILLVTASILWQPKLATASTLADAMVLTACDLANFLSREDEQKVVPKFSGLLAFPGGTSIGFTEMLKEELASYGIRVSSRANYVFDAHLERTDSRGDRGFSVRLIGNVMNDRGKIVHKTESRMIDDGKDLAEILGISTHFGPVTGPLRVASFRRAYDEETIHLDDDRKVLFGGEKSLYGIEVRVNNQPRHFTEDVEGLAYVDLRQREEYSILIHNHSNHEVAVELKIDGLNSFHFSEPSFRADGSPRYTYWIAHARSCKTEVVGWYKTNRRSSRFEITPFEESAVASAGIPFDKVGMISATFYASWKGGRPSDEPLVETVYTVRKPVWETRMRADGSTYKSYKLVAENRVATGFGRDVGTQTNGVRRTIGVPRATIAFRYTR